ncbi:spindle pole body protein [Gorgonomyces haynaldii]|nr:spindle pole body protein [Gorgonomyces haynaldii]
MNVYCCLVCGKYYQGRGRNTHAYFHSMEQDHHVFLNLKTQKAYVLPDGYEVEDPSLDDIRYVLLPTYSPEHVKMIDTKPQKAQDLSGKEYIPGYVGLNNIKHNDAPNGIFYLLNQVRPLRDHLLLTNPETTELIQRYTMLTRKVWNTRAFKAHVSPHEFVQELSNASKKRFELGTRYDPIDLIPWLLNQMQAALGKGFINKIFQGELLVETQQDLRDIGDESAPRFHQGDIQTKTTPFMVLSLDLPPTPLFTDEDENATIPQVSIYKLLEKYHAGVVQAQQGTLKRYKINRLPQYLIFTLRRLSKNSFKAVEKNPTIVNFPVKSAFEDQSGKHEYHLVGNLSHVSGRDAYQAQVLNRASGKWYQIQDLAVEEVEPQMVVLSETCVQIWERQP